MGPPGRQVDHRGHSDADGGEYRHRQDVLRLVDGEGVDRWSEVVVQRRGADQRRGHRRIQPAHQRRAHRQRQEQQHVRGQAETVHIDQQQRQQRRTRHPDQPAADRPRPAEIGHPADRNPPPALRLVLVRDDVHIDVARLPGHRAAHTGPVDVLPGRATAGAQHDLGRVHPSGELQQSGGRIVPQHRVVRTTQALHQRPLLDQRLRGPRAGTGQPVRAGDVHGQQLTTGPAGRDPGRPADQRRALRTARQTDHDPLARLPGALDPLLGPVLLQVLVDPVGRPQQRQLPQRRQIPRPEVVGERRVDLLRRVHVAVRQSAPQRLRRHVDQFDLIRPAHHLVRHGLPLPNPGDALDDVPERL